MAEGQRRLRILSQLTADGLEFDTRHLCQVSADVMGMSGAGIMLMSNDVSRSAVGTTDEVSALIEQLQYALGEGPSIDTYRQDRPISEPNLAHPRTSRWLAFSAPALEAGVQAVFGFPLHVGAVRLGSLNLYCDRPGPLTDEQHADGLVMADIVAQAVLLLQANAPTDTLAAELEAGAEFQYVVHQAAGMVSAQLDVSIAQALIRLRACSFSSGRPLIQVAEDVVARSLRLEG